MGPEFSGPSRLARGCKLEREVRFQADLTRGLEHLRLAEAACQCQRGVARERAGAIQRIDVVVAIHDLCPIHSRVAGKTRRTRGADEIGRNHKFIVCSWRMLVEEVGDVSSELQTVVFMRLAGLEFVS